MGERGIAIGFGVVIVITLIEMGKQYYRLRTIGDVSIEKTPVRKCFDVERRTSKTERPNVRLAA